MPADRKRGKPKATTTRRAKAKANVAKTKTKKAAAAPPKKAKAKAKAPKNNVAKKTVASPPKKAKPKVVKAKASPTPRAIAIAAQTPEERPLTDEEREAMTKVAQTALLLLEGHAETSESIVRSIGMFVDAVRSGTRPEPRTQDERLGLGVLWGEQVRAAAGWRWVHLSYADGFASYALVPDDRAFACFPLNRLPDLVKHASREAHRSVPLYALFDLIREGSLPPRRDNAYLVIG